MSADTYRLYTDGACSGNPGRGGWGAILIDPSGKRSEFSSAYAHTTNNRMELLAVIEGLIHAPANSHVVVTTDSQYVVNAFVKGWLTAWQRKGWRTAQKKPVANRDLWERLVALCDSREVTFTWIEGHAGHPENERCDTLAVKAYSRGPWKEDKPPSGIEQLF